MTTMTTPAVETLAGMPAGTWRIDPAHSSVGFSVRHLMSKVRGRFREVDGQIVIGPGLRDCSASVCMRADSVDTGMPPRDDDLRSSNFLDAEHHPDLTFASSSVEETRDGALTIVGDLTVRGIRREVRLQAEFLGLDETGLQGEQRIGFAARTTIRRSDFGVGAGAVEGSKLVVGNTVTIELDIEAALEADDAA
ncbi:MAG TPA: YceI family protein [Mycobacteriales bacterium]|jgi:polyisoprenoid-binding protein YceI|nr:YceI family protein [Mycobacteriales bacterium]